MDVLVHTLEPFLYAATHTQFLQNVHNNSNTYHKQYDATRNRQDCTAPISSFTKPKGGLVVMNEVVVTDRT